MAGDQDLFKFVIDYHRDRAWGETRALGGSGCSSMWSSSNSFNFLKHVSSQVVWESHKEDFLIGGFTFPFGDFFWDSWFLVFLLLCFFAFLLFCFLVFLLFCFSAFAFFCFSAFVLFPASLNVCFSASLLLWFMVVYIHSFHPHIINNGGSFIVIFNLSMTISISTYIYIYIYLYIYILFLYLYLNLYLYLYLCLSI